MSAPLQDAMSQRFFVETPIRGERATLTGSEAHHLAHVMRATPGMEVVLFDGTGIEAAARVETIERSEVRLQVLSREHVDRERAIKISLGVALPKGERQRQLVEKAVELGVSRLVPLKTARGVAVPTEGTLSKLRRAVIQASKQCGRNRLMNVAEPQDWAEFVVSANSEARWFAHPGGESLSRLAGGAIAGGQPASSQLAIGPEGGFSDGEVRLATDAGWTQVDLGARILRVETAATLLVAVAGMME